MGREPVSAGSGSVGETFGPLPGYNKGPLVERSAGLFFSRTAWAKTLVWSYPLPSIRIDL